MLQLEKRRQEISVLKVVKETTEDGEKKLAENEGFDFNIHK